MINMRSLIFVSLLVFCCFPWKLSSTPLIDSLKIKINTASNDSIKVERLWDLSTEYFYTYADSLAKAENYINEAVQLSQGIPDTALLINCLNARSKIYRESKRKQLALEDLKLAENLALAIGNEFRALCMLDNYASIKSVFGDFDEALEIRFKVLEGFRRLNKPKSAKITLSGIGYIYLEKKQFSKAKKYYHQVLSMNPEDKWAMGNLGIVYKNLHMLDSALHYYKKIEGIEKEGSRFSIRNKINIAALLSSQNKYAEALNYSNEVLKFYGDDSLEKEYNIYLSGNAIILTKMGKIKEAFEIIKNIKLESLDKLSLQDQKELANNISVIAERNGNFEHALKFHQRFHIANDSLNSVDRALNFKDIEEKYQNEKKEKLIIEQNYALQASKHKQRLYLFGFSYLILGLATGFYFIHLEHKNKRRLQKQELELKQAEINVLKQENQLIAMESILEGQEEERKRIAQDLHDNIGTLMTTIKMKMLALQKKEQNFKDSNIAIQLDDIIDKASTEIRRISHNMTPVAFELTGLEGAIEDLTHHLKNKGYEIDEELHDLDQIRDKQRALMLYRIFQEITQNIEKHSGGAFIKLESWKDEKTLKVIIKDNGKGMSEKAWHADHLKSMGLSGIKSRIKYLDGTIQMTNKSGTEFNIEIPIK